MQSYCDQQFIGAKIAELAKFGNVISRKCLQQYSRIGNGTARQVSYPACPKSD